MTEWDLVLVTCRCLGWPCRRCRCCNGLMCNGCNRPPCQCCCPPAAPAPRRSQRIANRRGACWRCCRVTAGAATCSVCHWLNWHRATTLHNPTACDTVHLGYTAQATTTFILFYFFFFFGGGTKWRTVSTSYNILTIWSALFGNSEVNVSQAIAVISLLNNSLRLLQFISTFRFRLLNYLKILKSNEAKCLNDILVSLFDE